MTLFALDPPPGPLCWLFPELLAVVPHSEVASLWVCAQALHADGSACAKVAPGPRGEAVAAILREHAVDAWQQVLVDDAATSMRHGLEWHLATLRGAIEASVAGRRLRCVAAPLTKQHAERRLAESTTAPWIAPIGHDRGRPGASVDGLDALDDPAWAAVLSEPALFAAAGLVPVLTDAQATPAHAEVAPTWFGVVNGAAAPFRAAHHAVVGALYPERAHLLRGFESLAVGGGDLYSESLRDLLARPVPTPARARALIVAVCGIDGAGKSSHVRALADHLTRAGLRVKTHKIYRHGVFHATVTDLTRACAGDQNLHLWHLERVAKAFDSVKYFCTDVEPDLAAYDVLIFDRYTPTHYAAGAGRCHFDPGTRELLAVYPPADRVFLLDAPVDAALARLTARSERTVDENPYMLSRYHAMLRALAEPEEMVVLDAQAPFVDNQAAIQHDVMTLWHARQTR